MPPRSKAYRIAALVVVASAFYLSALLEHKTVRRRVRATAADADTTPMPSLFFNAPAKCSTSNSVSITFDGLLDKSATPAILDALRSKSAYAAFHVPVAQDNESEYTTLLKKIFESGNTLGLRFPDDQNALTMTDSQIRDWIETQSKQFFKNVGKYPKFIRFGPNRIDQRVYDIFVGDFGFAITQGSQYSKLGDAFMQAIQPQVPRGPDERDSSIFILSNSNDAAQDLASALTKIKDSGYKIRKLEECVQKDAYKTSIDGQAKPPTSPSDLSGTFAMMASSPFSMLVAVMLAFFIF